MSGDFDARPLGEVLESLRAQVPFTVRAEPSILEQPITGKLVATPLRKGLEQLLAPFNYILSLGGDGKVSEVRITGVRDPTLLAAPRNTKVETPSVPPPPGGEPITPESLPPEMRQAFAPVQEPGTESTGPPGPPPSRIRPLPDFHPIENDTGPVHPHPERVLPLPEFEPFENTTGPPGP